MSNLRNKSKILDFSMDTLATFCSAIVYAAIYYLVTSIKDVKGHEVPAMVFIVLFGMMIYYCLVSKSVVQSLILLAFNLVAVFVVTYLAYNDSGNAIDKYKMLLSLYVLLHCMIYSCLKLGEKTLVEPETESKSNM